MKSVLILTYRDDPHSEAVCRHLDEQRIQHFRLDTDKLSTDYRITFDSKNLEFTISTDNECLVLDPSWNIWNRRVINPEVEDVNNHSLKEIIYDETKATWRGLMTSHSGVIINNPASNYRANSKINQLIFAQGFGNGIIVPDTLITNDQDELIKFYAEQNGKICFKLQKGATVQKDGGYFAVYTNLVDREALKYIHLIKKHPHLFQRYHEKLHEVRVVTIGSNCIGTAIYSQESERSRVDFRRYDFVNVPYKHIDLPKNVSEFCVAMLKNYGLNFGVFDFIYSDNEEYVFLELNPNGQWLWLEERSGYSISKELSDYLTTV